MSIKSEIVSVGERTTGGDAHDDLMSCQVESSLKAHSL